jgi:1D-myo-inositol-tetrakisphosphate 5-kinase/inositol-polyphosphate multikinase
MAKPIPARGDLVDYKNAVAGHDGTLCDVSGELFIKPCTQAEISFYESAALSHQDFAEFMPVFMGTLSLGQDQSKTIEEQGVALIAQHTLPEVVPKKQKTTSKKLPTTHAVVLENAAHGFKKPNILDVKLGVRLWADDAPQEKRVRFSKITEETTHKELGFRIAGMRVWQGPGIAGKEDVDEEGYKIYGREYGMSTIRTENVEEAFKSFIFVESAGIDQELSRLVSQVFLADVQRIQEILEGEESRMFSASLLFVFEGDGKALRAAMEEASTSPRTMVNDDGVSSVEDDEDEYSVPKIYAVKIIDFAHAEWVPGKGPDENSLVGVRSVARILENLGGSSSMGLHY